MKKISIVIQTVLLLAPFSAWAATGIGVSVDAHAIAGGTSTDRGNVYVGATTSVRTGSDGSVHVETKSGNTVDVDRSGDGRAVVTVNNPSDDKSGIEAAAKTDASVEAVDVDSKGAVNIAYKHHGWLFGIIPVSVTSHTTVSEDSSGQSSVNVSLPWWSFLVRGVGSIPGSVETDLKARPSVEADEQAHANAAARVDLIQTIITSLKASATAQGSVSTQ